MIKVTMYIRPARTRNSIWITTARATCRWFSRNSAQPAKSMAVEQGLGGGAPVRAPTYAGAMGHLYFNSVAAFEAAFASHAAAIMADIPNYTNIQPVIQISEVKM